MWGGNDPSGILERMQKITQLLETFAPEHYDLSLTLEREKRAFHGTVTIKGSAPEMTPAIPLHAKGLTYTLKGHICRSAPARLRLYK